MWQGGKRCGPSSMGPRAPCSTAGSPPTPPRREAGFSLPPDFYVDMRLFRPDSLKPEAYIPRFKLKHLEDIVEKIPGYVATSNELLDEAGLEGWGLTETPLY